MATVKEEAIARAICKCWGTVYSDEYISMDWNGKGQGFSVYDLTNDEFQINFINRKCWWIPGERVAGVKNIVKQKLTEAGLDITKLRIYGKTFTINWIDNRKFVKIHRIKFVEKS